MSETRASRKTLIHLLRLAASSSHGLSRSHIVRNNLTAKELNRVYAEPWESKGLHGLLHMEILPSRTRCGQRFFITSQGRNLLRVININPYFVPTIPAGRQPFISFAAKMYAEKKARKLRRRRKAQRKYWAVRANPKYTADFYDIPVDATRLPAIGSKGWRELHPVIKIRLLRQRVRRSQLQQRFRHILQENQ